MRLPVKRQILAMVALGLCRSTWAFVSTELQADKVVSMEGGWLLSYQPAGQGSKAKRRCWGTKVYRDEGSRLGMELQAQLGLFGV